MTAPNHLVGGYVFTSFFGSLFFGINIFASPLALFLTALFSLLPDIDHRKSIIGRTPGLTWIATWINNRYGHRTITHSVIFLSILTMIIAVFSSTWATIFGLAYLSHLIFDTFTLSGVPLFYPFSKTIHVIVSNPAMRMRSSNIRGEVIAFCVFVILQLILLNSGLIQKGFWTSYNQTFATPLHVFSEFSKADDLLKVDYEYKEGTESVQGEGYVIESSGTKISLIKESGDWLILDGGKMNLVSTVPHHTGKNYRFENLSFINIDLDSLNKICNSGAIRKLDLVANNEFLVTVGGVGERSKKFKADYVNAIYFEIDDKEIEKENFAAHSSPRIRTLQLQIENLRRKDSMALADYQENRRELEDLETTVFTTTSLYELEQRQKRIKELRGIKEPGTNEIRISELNAQIQEIRNADYQKNRNKKLEIERKYREALPEETRFTGFARVVVIE